MGRILEVLETKKDELTESVCEARYADLRVHATWSQLEIIAVQVFEEKLILNFLREHCPPISEYFCSEQFSTLMLG